MGLVKAMQENKVAVLAHGATGRKLFGVLVPHPEPLKRPVPIPLGAELSHPRVPDCPKH